MNTRLLYINVVSEQDLDPETEVDDEQDAGMSEVLSRLWLSNTTSLSPLLPSLSSLQSQDIPEEVCGCGFVGVSVCVCVCVCVRVCESVCVCMRTHSIHIHGVCV